MELKYTQTACVFKENGKCAVLTETNCVNCKFGKTRKQFNAERDKAIRRCRRLGICDKCKYTKRQCRLSTEPVIRTPIGMW